MIVSFLVLCYVIYPAVFEEETNNSGVLMVSVNFGADQSPYFLFSGLGKGVKFS